MFRSELVAAAGLLALTTACGTVTRSHLRDDYYLVDRTKTLRLAVITAPAPDGNAKLGTMWARIAQRYVNHHRDFVVKEARSEVGLPADACHDDLEGVLHLVPQVVRHSEEVKAGVQARLFRCLDGESVWTAAGEGAWPLQDPTISEVIRLYQDELGPEVGPWVPASFHLLRAVLDTLPRPSLPDDTYVMEKIELSE